MGGTGLEPVTPSLSIWCSRSRQFAGLRSAGMVGRNPSGERTVERTRTNIERCHCCHASEPLQLVLTDGAQASTANQMLLKTSKSRIARTFESRRSLPADRRPSKVDGHHAGVEIAGPKFPLGHRRVVRTVQPRGLIWRSRDGVKRGIVPGRNVPLTSSA